jgi:hypothetical protein
MTRRKLYTSIGIAALLIASMAQGLAYVHATVAQYSKGSRCGLTGVPALLQKAHFIPPGGCKEPNKGKCNNAACTLSNPPSGKSDKGHCGLVGSTCGCLPD